MRRVIIGRYWSKNVWIFMFIIINCRHNKILISWCLKCISLFNVKALQVFRRLRFWKLWLKWILFRYNFIFIHIINFILLLNTLVLNKRRWSSFWNGLGHLKSTCLINLVANQHWQPYFAVMLHTLDLHSIVLERQGGLMTVHCFEILQFIFKKIVCMIFMKWYSC